MSVLLRGPPAPRASALFPLRGERGPGLTGPVRGEGRRQRSPGGSSPHGPGPGAWGQLQGRISFLTSLPFRDEEQGCSWRSREPRGRGGAGALRGVSVTSSHACPAGADVGRQGRRPPPGLFLSRPSSPPPQAAPLGSGSASAPAHQGEATGARAGPWKQWAGWAQGGGWGPSPPTPVRPQVHRLPGDRQPAVRPVILAVLPERHGRGRLPGRARLAGQPQYPLQDRGRAE